MNIAILKTGLFPDAKTVEDALNHFVASDYLFSCDATRDDLTEADWDQALDEIMSADRVFVI